MMERIEQNIRRRGLLEPGQPALVAVSGGLDSMVLLHVLHQLSAKNRWQLTVAHLNHQLRGRGSDADERLVARTAKKLGLPLVARRADVRKLAAGGKLSLEMAARQARHEFLAQTASDLRIRTVTLAHHADDQIELFFLRLLRGSGGEGLAGMKWKSPSPVARMVTLVRPLLDFSKSELAACAREHKIPFREDASNASLDIQRNRVRHELLPWLRRRYQPALGRTVSRVMEIIGAESEFMDGTAREWLRQKKRGTFAALPVALQRRCVQAQLREQGIAADFDLIERLRGTAGERFCVAPGMSVWRDAAGKIQISESRPVVTESSAREIELGRSGKVSWDGLAIRWRVEPGTSLPKRQSGVEFFDADKVGGRVVLRHWRAGDRFQPIGMKSPVKLQDLFINMKIPQARRHQLVIAEAASGEIFWVEGLRISERFKLAPPTVRRLRWSWRVR